MSKLVSILADVEKDLGHAVAWIQDGVKIAEPFVGAVEPQIGAIITEVEKGLAAIPAGSKFTLASIQQFITAMATASVVKTATPGVASAGTPVTLVLQAGKAA